MIDLLLALHGLAHQRGDGLHPALAEGLRKIQRLDDGRLIGTDGDTAVRTGDKDMSRGSEQTETRIVRRLRSL
jgi:hypothetical protein